jgi:CRP-like cAMP-binding protein
MTRRAVLLEETVDVVEALPDLHDAVPRERLSAARRTLRARALTVRRGRWNAREDAEQMLEGGAGFLIVEGALIRCETVAHRTSGELLGPGDIVRPGHDLYTDGQFTSYYRAISEVRLAVLDARFTRAAALVPELVPALLASMTRRAGTVARQLVIVQSQSVETRILVTLNYLADRWGVMTVDGIVLPEFLSHGTLALLLGARRPSVTSAMVRLSERGEVQRRIDGRWLLGRQVESLVA